MCLSSYATALERAISQPAVDTSDVDHVVGVLEEKLKTQGRGGVSADARVFYDLLCRLAKEYLQQRCVVSASDVAKSRKKGLFFMGPEFFFGGLECALNDLCYEGLFREALARLHVSLDEVYKVDIEFGNTPGGHLATRFVDAAASNDVPVFGYGMMYRCDGCGDESQIMRFCVNPCVSYELEVCNAHVRAEARDLLMAVPSTASAVRVRLWIVSDLHGVWPNEDDEAKRLAIDYIAAAATIRDIVSLVGGVDKIGNLARYAAIPIVTARSALMVAELFRILHDEEKFVFDEAWKVCAAVFSYECGDLMDQSHQKWPHPVFERVLPRHLELISLLNHYFLSRLRELMICDHIISDVSAYQEGPVKYIRMANVALIGSSGPSQTTFQMPSRKDGWQDCVLFRTSTCQMALRRSDTYHLYRDLKLRYKETLAGWIKRKQGIDVSASHLFDVQIEDLGSRHRQLLNVLGIIYRYLAIRHGYASDFKPKVSILYGDPSSDEACLVKLIERVADVVNSDGYCRDFLKVVYISRDGGLDEHDLLAAADVTEQLGVPGANSSAFYLTECAPNSSLLLGIIDDASREVRNAVGSDNVFLANTASKSYKLESVLKLLTEGDVFGDPHEYDSLLSNLDDIRCVFDSYLEKQGEVDQKYSNHVGWIKKTLTVIGSLEPLTVEHKVAQSVKDRWGFETATFGSHMPESVDEKTDQTTAGMRVSSDESCGKLDVVFNGKCFARISSVNFLRCSARYRRNIATSGDSIVIETPVIEQSLQEFVNGCNGGEMHINCWNAIDLQMLCDEWSICKELRNAVDEFVSKDQGVLLVDRMINGWNRGCDMSRYERMLHDLFVSICTESNYPALRKIGIQSLTRIFAMNDHDLAMKHPRTVFGFVLSCLEDDQYGSLASILLTGMNFSALTPLQIDRLFEDEKVDFGCLKGTICRNFKEHLSEIEKYKCFARRSQKVLEEKLSELEELKTRLSSQLMLLRGELLREVKLGQDNALKEMNTALANLAPQLDGHESWLKGQESRLNCHESRLGDHDSRLNGHESWLHGHESRLGDHDSRLSGHQKQLDLQEFLIDDNLERLSYCEENLFPEGWQYASSEQSGCRHDLKLFDHEMRLSELKSKMKGGSD